LKSLGLARPGAGTIADVSSCPGTDTCKLGIASSRGLAGELTQRLAATNAQLTSAIRGLRIKVSGCFNSCGQHHVADLGFYGNSRNINGYTVPHFQVMLGGKWLENGGSYGLAWGRSRRSASRSWSIALRSVSSPTDTAVNRSSSSASGSARRRSRRSWTSSRRFRRTTWTRRSTATGATRGSSRSATWAWASAPARSSRRAVRLHAAESEAFEAQLLLDEGKLPEADDCAYRGDADGRAKRSCSCSGRTRPSDPTMIVDEFRARFVEPKLFWDTYHAGQFANYLFNRHEGPDRATRATPCTSWSRKRTSSSTPPTRPTRSIQQQQQEALTSLLQPVPIVARVFQPVLAVPTHMDSSKLIIKLYADDRSADFNAKDAVPIFHSWIQSRAIADHLLIDVADYTHVPDGPAWCWSRTRRITTWIASMGGWV
jgi:hypothetical protein